MKTIRIKLLTVCAMICLALSCQNFDKFGQHDVGLVSASLNNANLTNIVVNRGILQPVFVFTTTGYLDAPVSYSQNSESITPTAADSGATIKVNGTTVASGSAYTLTNLAVGPTTVTIAVTAPDGITTKTYTVTVYRAVPVFKTGAGPISGHSLDPREDAAIQRGVAWPNPRFTDNGDGTITDNMTGLVWMKNMNTAGTGKTWAGVFDYIRDLNTGTASGNCGYYDWRLPNARELISVILCAREVSYLWLPSQGFTNIANTCSSTTVAINTSYAFLADMVYGLGDSVKMSNYSIWPVRAMTSTIPATGQTTIYATGDDGDIHQGVQMPSLRFRDNGDGTITDNMTGLVWLKDANKGGAMEWMSALDYVDSFNSTSLCGFNDWRLPTINELESLMNYQSAPYSWFNGHGFSNVQSGYYWSATSDASSLPCTWVFDMSRGEVASHYPKIGNHFYVWSVREAR